MHHICSNLSSRFTESDNLRSNTVKINRTVGYFLVINLLQPSSYTRFLFDAVLLYAKILDKALAEDGNITDGRYLAKLAAGTSFSGKIFFPAICLALLLGLLFLQGLYIWCDYWFGTIGLVA